LATPTRGKFNRANVTIEFHVSVKTERAVAPVMSLNLAQVGSEPPLETARGVHAASTSEVKAGRAISVSGHCGR
jgi:hypothetical protein